VEVKVLFQECKAAINSASIAYFSKVLKLAYPVAILASVQVVGSSQAYALDVMKRSDWGAADPIVNRDPPIDAVTEGNVLVAAENELQSTSNIMYLTVHHTGRTASKHPLAQNIKSFQDLMFDYTIKYSEERSKRIYLSDVPYHYFIDHLGKIAEGRQEKYAAYSNTVYQTPIESHITVVMDGNFEVTKPSDDQVSSLKELLIDLSKKHSVSLDNIRVHKEVASTTCPGQHLESAVHAIIAELNDGG
jgi:hypothetical protein